MTRLPVGAEIEAEHPPHGGHWERIAPGKLRLISATYPQAETPAEAAWRAAQDEAALAPSPDHVLAEPPAEAAARAEGEAAAPLEDDESSAKPRASRKKEG